MLYFAFGANMEEKRLRAENRCPEARFIFTACLPAHRLVFTRRAEDASGTANVTPEHSSVVWGVVYDISDSDRRKLDAREGIVQRAYRPKEVLVHPQGDLDQRVLVLTYVMGDPSDLYQAPNREYLDSIIRGARQWKLPEEYIAQLERVSATG